MKYLLPPLLAAMLLLAACSNESATQGAAPEETAAAAPVVEAATASPFAMQAEKLAENVYAIVSPARTFPNTENLGWNSNTAFVVTGNGVLMFDTGSSLKIGEALLQVVRSVTDQPVRWVINTHVHGDHWLGNGAFISDDLEQIIASDLAIELMHEQGAEWVSRFNAMTEGAIGEFEPVPARDAVSESGVHQFADLEAHILYSPRAHSPGDLAVWIPEKQVLLAADAIYTGRGPATFDSDVQGWIAFLEEFKTLEPQVVLPGHGEVGGIEAVNNMHDFFQTLWGLVETGYEAGQMDYEITERAREEMAHFEAIYPGMSETLGEAVSHVYLQVEAALF
jgi:glyoxylase-like metal-dependent hydrolase (beta-lactamase superfamily II)